MKTQTTKQAYNHLTPELLNDLKKRRLKGASTRDLAKVYGITNVGILNRLSKISFTPEQQALITKQTQEIRLTKFKKTNSEKSKVLKEKILTLNKKGWTISKIYEKVGVCPVSISKYVKREKYTPNSKLFRSFPHIVKELESGGDIHMLCAEHSILQESAYRWFKKFGYSTEQLRYYFGRKRYIDIRKIRNAIDENPQITVKELAKICNMSSFNVQTILKEEANRSKKVIKPNFSKIHAYFSEIEKQKDKVLDLYLQGNSPNSVSILTGLSIRLIHQVLDEYAENLEKK